MSEVIELICKNCGGKANFDLMTNIFKCEFCDSQFLIKNKNNNISMQPLIHSMDSLQNGMDKTASEFAIVRIQKELDNLNKQFEPYSIEWNRLVKVHQSKNNVLITRKIAFFSLIFFIFLFIVSVNKDLMGLGFFSMFSFFCVIVFLVSSTIRNVSRENDEKKYLKMEQIVMPIINEIEKYQEDLKIHLNRVKT